MTALARFLQLIKASNPSASRLTLNDLDFSTPRVSNVNNRNSEITATAKQNTGYAGSLVLYFNRKDLASFGQYASLVVDTALTPAALVTALNANLSANLALTDLQNVAIPPLIPGSFTPVVLTATSDSMEWQGSVNLRLAVPGVGQAPDDTALTAVLGLSQDLGQLQDQFVNFSQQAFVFKIAGLSGEITKIQLGIDRVDNTSDIEKPISELQQAGLDQKLNDNIIRTRRTNVSNDDLKFGQPVWAFNSTDVELASSDNINRRMILGLVCEDIMQSQGGQGLVQTTAILTGSVAQWEFVTGDIGGLITRKTYYVSTNAGMLTPYPPIDNGLYLTAVGVALSTTELSINIQQPILL